MMNLLPCPLCGNDQIGTTTVISSVPEHTEWVSLYCSCCGLNLPPNDREAASLIWNQRAPRPENAREPKS